MCVWFEQRMLRPYASPGTSRAIMPGRMGTLSASPELISLEDTLLYLTAFFGAFLAAVWLGLIFWTYRDITSRSHDRLLRFLATFVVALLSLPGLVVYLILRPPRTLEEAYRQTLEEEALLSEIEERATCPGCGAQTERDWLVCANCHTHLRKTCLHCDRLLELAWRVCPYCATPVIIGRQEEAEEPGQEVVDPSHLEEPVRPEVATD